MLIFIQICSNLSLLTNVQDAHGVKDFWANRFTCLQNRSYEESVAFL